ncbi:MAG: cupin domain-containing protein [Spirochaetales bacterium]|nr:cupin domain-containing protein [Spirochaetales bacterium]
MIIKGNAIPFQNNRRPFDLEGREIKTKHFVTRITAPDNPFLPHKHEQSELWFILEGNGVVTLEGKDFPVEKADLIILDPWQEHGLRTETEITWICLG